jgi:hypothetical protein
VRGGEEATTIPMRLLIHACSASDLVDLMSWLKAAEFSLSKLNCRAFGDVKSFEIELKSAAKSF